MPAVRGRGRLLLAQRLQQRLVVAVAGVAAADDDAERDRDRQQGEEGDRRRRGCPGPAFAGGRVSGRRAFLLIAAK